MALRSRVASHHRPRSTAMTLSPAVADGGEDVICVRGKGSASKRDASSVSMPISFLTGSIAGKMFYEKVTTRLADDGNGWTVMLDYRTLKTPSKRPLKLPTLAIAKAIVAEWEYQME